MILSGKECLITGGGTGIGRATAQRFAEEGARVVVFGRSRDTLKETASAIGEKCTVHVGDVADSASLVFAIEAMPALDVLVSNAAVSFAVEPLRPDDLDGFVELTRHSAVKIAGCECLTRGTPESGWLRTCISLPQRATHAGWNF
jgi:NAD(P)-dependent dehydrogenase (short-subunit alcohol dehydrogenase family)